MSNIVENNVKPSGPPVVPFPSAGMLPGIPSQPAARQHPEHVDRKLSRLVPAKVGRPGHVQTVWIDCPEWCVIDHGDRVGHLDDVMHYSDCDVVEVVTLTDDETGHSELMLNISSDPSASDPRLRTAHLVINNNTSTDAYLTPDMAEELADELIAFAAQLRSQAQTVRLYNRAGGQA